jgi:hypothetical protein
MKACKFSFSITIHNAFVSVDSNSSISVTAHNQTHIHTKFYFFIYIARQSPPKILTFLLESLCMQMRR